MGDPPLEVDELVVIAREHMAVEPIALYVHGSRAYGYSHPGSDYDIRGVFVERDPEVYLSPTSVVRSDARLEEPPFDIHLWEIRKFVRLLLKYNPIVYELLCINPVYVSPTFREDYERLLASSRRLLTLYPLSMLYNHYHGMFRSWMRYLRKGVKKAVLHVLRCFLAMAYICRMLAPPPITMDELILFARDRYPEIAEHADRVLCMARRGEKFDVDERIVAKISSIVPKLRPPNKRIGSNLEIFSEIRGICVAILRKHICGAMETRHNGPCVS